MTEQEYNEEIIALTIDIQKGIYENIHEAVDCHELVIYTCKSEEVIKYSCNARYAYEEACGAPDYESFVKAMAYWCMTLDIQDIGV